MAVSGFGPENEDQLRKLSGPEVDSNYLQSLLAAFDEDNWIQAQEQRELYKKIEVVASKIEEGLAQNFNYYKT